MIISQNSNDVYYAYTRGRFWRWDESARAWKESHLLAQKFGKAKTVEKRLTPEAFLTSDEFIPMDDYELPERMLAALRDAKPCKNAPIEPVEEEPTCKTAPNADAAAITAECAVPNATAETPTTSESAADASESVPAASPQSCESGPAASAEASSASLLSTAPQDKPLTFIQQDKCPEFDYSDLPEQTVATLHLAESGYLHGKKLAEKGLVYMGDNIALAHDELCSTVVAQCDNGRFAKKEDTFRAWCLHIGITKDSAYRLLQVSALLADSSPRQRAVLESLPPTLLYAVAKPSAPPELVEKVKNGEVSSNKAYQDLLKENQQLRTDRVNAMNQAEREKARAEKAEAERDKARADQISTAKDCNRLGLKASQEKDRADKAEAREEEAWKLQSKAEARAKNAEDALKKQPIVGVTDPEEVRRQADALAAEAKAQASRQIEDAQRRAREAEARYQKLQQDADGFLAPEQSCAQQAKIIADSMRSMYLGWFGLASTTGTPLARMAAPIYQVCDEIRESLEEDTTINPTAEGSVEDAEREALFE